MQVEVSDLPEALENAVPGQTRHSATSLSHETRGGVADSIACPMRDISAICRQLQRGQGI